MSKHIPNGISLTVILSILIFLAGFAYFGDTSIRQARHMRLAGEFLPAITNEVAARSEFHEVRIGVGTGAGGCLMVTGHVETRKQASDLSALITNTKPPVPVLYYLKIFDEPDSYRGPSLKP